MTIAIEQRVRETAAAVFNVEPGQLTEQSSPETLEGWDSLQQLNLVLAIEQEFGLSLEPEDIERMASIGGVVQVVEEKMTGPRLAGQR
jgi:acyl carrier protein